MAVAPHSRVPHADVIFGNSSTPGFISLFPLFVEYFRQVFELCFDGLRLVSERHENAKSYNQKDEQHDEEGDDTSYTLNLQVDGVKAIRVGAGALEELVALVTAQRGSLCLVDVEGVGWLVLALHARAERVVVLIGSDRAGLAEDSAVARKAL